MKARGKAYNSLISDGSVELLPGSEDFQAAPPRAPVAGRPQGALQGQNNLTSTDETACGEGDSRQHKSDATCPGLSAVWGREEQEQGGRQALGVHMFWVCVSLCSTCKQKAPFKSYLV